MISFDWGDAQAYLEGDFVYVTFPPTKQLPDELAARWLKSRREWRVPGTYGKLRMLKDYYPQIDFGDDIEIRLAEPWGFPRHNISTEHPSWKKLYPYQQDAVAFLLSSPHSGSLLNLSPGLGKTAVAVVAADLIEAENVLIICPKTLIPTWQREVGKWSFWNLDAISGEDSPSSGKIITNYAQLSRYDYKRSWDLVVADESIKVKSRKTKRFEALKAIVKGSSRLWLLSGSPVSRYVDDLWAQLHLMAPRHFTSYWRFARRYCLVDRTVWGWSVTGNQPGLDLASDLRDFMFVRHQEEVLPDLPDYIYQVYDLELLPEQDRVYQQALEQFLIRLDTGEEMILSNKMARLIRLQQIVSHPVNINPDISAGSAKLEALLELVSFGNIPQPAIIWTHFRLSAVTIANRLKKNYRVGLAIGDTDVDSVLEKFTSAELDFLVLSLGVGKYGLTLTNARAVVYFDKTWDADAYIQSKYRVRRIGLEHRPFYITLRCPGTVDELVEQNLAGKLPAISELSNADLSDMLRGLR